MNTATLLLNLALLGAGYCYPTFYTTNEEFIVVDLDVPALRYTGPVVERCAMTIFEEKPKSAWDAGCQPWVMHGAWWSECNYDSARLAMCGDCVRKDLETLTPAQVASIPEGGAGSTPRWHGLWLGMVKRDTPAAAFQGGKYSYVYPVVLMQAGEPGLGIANIVYASILWNVIPEERRLCDYCVCEEGYDGFQWAENETPGQLVPTYLFPRPTNDLSQFQVNNIIAHTLSAEGLCDILEEMNVDQIVVEYGFNYKTLWVNRRQMCDATQTEGQAEAEVEGDLEGQAEGQAEAEENDWTGNFNPFDSTCPETDEFDGYDRRLVIDVFKPMASLSWYQEWRPFDLGIMQTQKVYYSPGMAETQEHGWGELKVVDDSVHMRQSASCDVQTSTANPPAGGEACAIRRDGAVIAYKEQAFRARLPLGSPYRNDAYRNSDGTINPNTNGDSVMWHYIGCQPSPVNDNCGNGNTMGPPVEHGLDYADRTIPFGTLNMASTSNYYWIQKVKDKHGEWYRINHGGVWYRSPMGSALFGQSFFGADDSALLMSTPLQESSEIDRGQLSSYLTNMTRCWNQMLDQTTWMELTDTELAMSGSGGGGGGLSGGTRLIDSQGNAVDPLSKEDMTSAVAQGTAVGMEIAGNGLASKIADALSSGFINQTGGGLGYATGSSGQNGGGGNVSFDANQAGGGSGADTGRGAGGEGEGYGTAAQRIAGQGGGGRGEGGTTPALVNSQGMFSQMQNDVESLVAEPLAPRWEIDVPWLDGSLHFVVDFSGDTYGFSTQVYQLVVIFRSLVLCVFVAWWAWCLMRPLFMEGW